MDNGWKELSSVFIMSSNFFSLVILRLIYPTNLLSGNI